MASRVAVDVAVVVVVVVVVVVAVEVADATKTTPRVTKVASRYLAPQWAAAKRTRCTKLISWDATVARTLSWNSTASRQATSSMGKLYQAPTANAIRTTCATRAVTRPAVAHMDTVPTSALALRVAPSKPWASLVRNASRLWNHCAKAVVSSAPSTLKAKSNSRAATPDHKKMMVISLPRSRRSKPTRRPC